MKWKQLIQNVHKYIAVSMLFLLIIVLCACGKKTESSKTTLVLATFGENGEMIRQVEAFQKKNPNCQIEIREYTRSEQPEGDGIAKLKREIASGKGPDLINYGHFFTTCDLSGDYTIDLMPYIENQESDTYFMNIISAFSNDNQAHVIPIEFQLESFVSRKDMLGGLENWNINEMIQCYENQNDDVVLYPGEMKKDVFATMIAGGVDYYIDWQQGTCRFNGDEFKRMLAFCNTFPNAMELSEDESVLGMFQNGKSLLYSAHISDVYNVAEMETIFDKDITYIGFPVDGKSGAMIHVDGPMLAISRNSKHPDEAWEFISQCISLESQKQMNYGFPINRQAFQILLDQAQKTEYTKDSEGTQQPVAKSEIIFEGCDAIPIYSITKAQADTMLHFVESAEISSSIDMTIHSILLEECQSYFDEDKSLEEVTEIMQSRVSLYISENKS